MLLKLEIFLTGSSDNFEDQNYMFNFEWQALIFNNIPLSWTLGILIT